MSSLSSTFSSHPDDLTPITGLDGRTQWAELSTCWTEFACFWSKPNNPDLQSPEYPYALDLRLSPNMRGQIASLIELESTILVTQSYAELYERIKAGLRLDNPSTDKRTRITRSLPLQDGVIITGQPGTGMLSFCRSTVLLITR